MCVALIDLTHLPFSFEKLRRLGGTLLSLAPMMEITDRHFRYFLRLLTRRTTLYTEMYVANTLLHAPQAVGMLRFSPQERPSACQIGGSDPEALARAAALVEAAGLASPL